MRRAQLAINSISTRQSRLEEALTAYAQAGFHQVEFALAQVKAWLAEGHTVDELHHLLARSGLRSIGGFEAHVACFTTPEEQRANHALTLANAALIDELGGGILVVGCDGPPQPTLAVLDIVAETLRRLAREIEDRHVTLALEFNWSPLVKSLQSAVRVAEKANHPHVGVLFDTAHYYTTTTKLEHLTAATVPWIKHVHLNDMRDKPGELSHCNADRVLPGSGILDVAGIIALLEQYGYTGSFSLEMFNEELWQLPASEAARRCYQSLLPLCIDGGIEQE
jgi:2-keto-myo-inositol isomerase